MENYNRFLAAYIATLLTLILPDGNYTPDDLAAKTRRLIEADCRAFWDAHGAAIERVEGAFGSHATAVEYAGYHFWLTRNGRGASFEDGQWPELLGTVLYEAAQAFGERELYVGDDGLIYQW